MDGRHQKVRRVVLIIALDHCALVGARERVWEAQCRNLAAWLREYPGCWTPPPGSWGARLGLRAWVDNNRTRLSRGVDVSTLSEVDAARRQRLIDMGVTW